MNGATTLPYHKVRKNVLEQFHAITEGFMSSLILLKSLNGPPIPSPSKYCHPESANHLDIARRVLQVFDCAFTASEGEI